MKARGYAAKRVSSILLDLFKMNAKEDFLEVVNKLQAEARSTQAILEEIAGLEKYISETYTSRVFYELIQNSDDCLSTRFHALRFDQDLYFFNDGTIFSASDLESICRSAFSGKQRGINIGYRGIGFKSVSSVCDAVTIVSGELKIHFSKENTRKLLGTEGEVPLLRVPHWGFIAESHETTAQSYLQLNHLTTCFILHNFDQEQLLFDLKGVSNGALLFLRTLNEVSIRIDGEFKHLSRNIDAMEEFSSNNVTSKNLYLTTSTSSGVDTESNTRAVKVWKYREIEIACDLVAGVPQRLPKNQAYAQAFLPMLTTTGLGCIINGDFSTDPSRTRISPDSNTKNALSQLVELIENLLFLLSKGLLTNNEQSLLQVLTPYRNADIFDISPAYIANQIKTKTSSTSSLLKGFVFKPAWMGMTEYERYCIFSGEKSLVFDQIKHLDFQNFFDKFGVKYLRPNKLIEWLGGDSMPLATTVAFLTACIRDNTDYSVMLSIDRELAFLARIHVCDDGIVRSSRDIKQYHCTLDFFTLQELFILRLKSTEILNFLIHFGIPPDAYPKSFHKKLIEITKGQANKSYQDLTSFLLGDTIEFSSSSKSILNDDTILPSKIQLTDETDSKSEQNLATSGVLSSAISYPAPHWRQAEEFACELMISMGFSSKDVSKSNYGYDLECTSESGGVCYVEVKLLAGIGESFRITDNEYYVARERSSKYWVLLIVQPDKLAPPSHYSLLKDFYPAFNEFVKRRCIKYELVCTDYSAQYVQL